MDVVDLQRLLGHRSANTTLRYDMRGEKARRAAVEAACVPFAEAAFKKGRVSKAQSSRIGLYGLSTTHVVSYHLRRGLYAGIEIPP